MMTTQERTGVAELADTLRILAEAGQPLQFEHKGENALGHVLSVDPFELEPCRAKRAGFWPILGILLPPDPTELPQRVGVMEDGFKLLAYDFDNPDILGALAKQVGIRDFDYYDLSPYPYE